MSRNWRSWRIRHMWKKHVLTHCLALSSIVRVLSRWAPRFFTVVDGWSALSGSSSTLSSWLSLAIVADVCPTTQLLTCTRSASADANYSSAGYWEHSQSSPVWRDRLLPLGLTCWAECHLHIRETQRHVSQLHPATPMHKWHTREGQGWTLEEDYRLGWLLPTSLYQIVQKMSGVKGSCGTMSRMMLKYHTCF